MPTPEELEAIQQDIKALRQGQRTLTAAGESTEASVRRELTDLRQQLEAQLDGALKQMRSAGEDTVALRGELAAQAARTTDLLASLARLEGRIDALDTRTATAFDPVRALARAFTAPSG